MFLSVAIPTVAVIALFVLSCTSVKRTTEAEPAYCWAIDPAGDKIKVALTEASKRTLEIVK